LKKRRKYDRISGRRNGAEECCLSSATQGPIGKGHPPRTCSGALGQCRLALERDKILFCREATLSLNSEEALSWSKDNNLDEVNEAILLALSNEPFSSVPSVRQIARRIGVPKSTAYRRLIDSLHFTVRHQISSLDS
jgi:hypothetical protein